MSAIFHAGISGYRGRMGRAVSQVLDARDDVVVAARFDWGETADISLCDVIIDFSTPDASVALAQAAAARGAPALVIGSTGMTPDQDAEILKASETVAIVKSGNFSLGVNVLIGLVQQAAQRLDAQEWDIEITESHHRRKVDAPSGTALMLGEAAAEGRSADLSDLRSPPYDGVQGERELGKIGFSSIRAGGVIGEHSVLFASEAEVLTLGHSAIDRSLFAKGAVAAAAWVRSRRPGLYDMQDVLGFRQA
ncbi:4-hydroxy-tetrahydrodipicolinate reductase [Brevundimonas sp. SORGH_AS_0993]|uniref:4-hydroxy-tetrahydrodipicolinate reductase n=1 Tax=Brevundimonas sp. SORGH_AS_0993 TaxID=3041794 RepID=UPI00278ADC29|nr:4-hydroxy-tetrahydrodipicolinate reductase [Brevundimonas sp. SORGH_AS_0993]MDQ1154955.1 4-hydroxy-tetrahydrodipicolinate reductase [Brevundimonas sp. SORGH_AS_0993]